MNRRRFAVTAIAAAAVGATLRARASLSPASRGYTIEVKYALTNVKGYVLHTRTYEGRTAGPTLETTPGSTLSVRIVNNLPPDKPAACPKGPEQIPDAHTMMQIMEPDFTGKTRTASKFDCDNNPHLFNTTNLHVHGIQTTPHLFHPIGTSNPMAPMIKIHPGQSLQYDFPVPKDHPSGLHWYHPHKHGSTDVQVSGGMAGLIVVRGPIDTVPEIATAREIFMVVQSLDVNPSRTIRGAYDREYLAYQPPARGGYSTDTLFTMFTVNAEGVCWYDTDKNTYKPLGVPEYSVKPGEVVRLRFLNGTNAMPLMLTLPGFEAWQIGLDGINTLTPIYKDISGKDTAVITPHNFFSAPIRFAMSGNRVELLLRAPKKEGTYTLASLATQGVEWMPRPKIDLAAFVVSGEPVEMGIPAHLPVPTREYPLIADADIKARRIFSLESGPNPRLLFDGGFTIDGKLYDMMETQTRPKVGTAEEWTLVNKSQEAHPVHIHVNSFQVTRINDKPLDPVEIWDNFVVPPAIGSTPGKITIRIRFVEFTGKSVFHCHVLSHEDTGMMKNILIT
jgi:suppressor of ftsI